MAQGVRGPLARLRSRFVRLAAGDRIVVLALGAFLPLVALFVFSLLQTANADVARVQSSVGDVSDGVALGVAGEVSMAQSVALTLGNDPGFAQQSAAAVVPLLQAALTQHPNFVNVWAVRADGSIYAAAVPLAAGQAASAQGQPYFQAVQGNPRPVVTTVRGVPGFPALFAPVASALVPNGGGSIHIAFRIVGLLPAAGLIGVPPNSIVSVLDSHGIVIARTLDPARWQGVDTSNTPAWNAVRGSDQGTYLGPSLDGVTRLHGFQTVPGTGWRAVVGEPSPAVFAPVRTVLLRDSILFLASIAIGVILTRRGRQLAEQLDTQRRRLQDIINQLPEGVLVTRPTGRVTIANDALEQLLGVPVRPGAPIAGQITGRVTWLYNGREIPPAGLPWRRAANGEQVTGEQIVIRRADGSGRDVLVNALPLRNARGGIEEVLFVAGDITVLKDLDRSKDVFISTAAHELRNPLAGLKGYTELLERTAAREGLPPESARLVTAIDQQASRLTELTRRLLDVSRLQLGKLELVRQPTDIVVLAHQVQESLQLTTTKHRITMESPSPSIVGNWDGEALRQVLNNLVGNAIKYAPGGTIDIRIVPDRNEVRVEVSDQGPGIPPAQLPHLFERFRQAGARPEERAGGLGLGLYLARGIIEAHGGHVGVQSQVGQGSTFWFTLPLAGKPVALPAESVAARGG